MRTTTPTRRVTALGQPQPRLAVMPKLGGVPTDQVQQKITDLFATGMTLNMIARAAGVSHQTARNIRDGHYATVSQAVAAAISDVTPRPMKHQSLVMPYPTRRRIEGLTVMGWSLAAQAAEAGRPKAIWRQYAFARFVTWETHCLVADVYDRISHIDGGSDRAKSGAARRGFVHPMMWDDIDDYDEVPGAIVGADVDIDEIVVRRLVNGQHVETASVAERQEAVRILTAQGQSARQIAVTLRVSDKTIERDREALAC